MLPASAFESVFNYLPMGSYILTPEAEPTILAVNDTFLKVTSRRRDELVGAKLFDAFPLNPEDPEDTGALDLQNSILQAIETGRPAEMPVQRYPIQFTLPNGEERFEERFWNAVNTPIFDEQGKLIYIWHRTTDVTEQVRSQATLLKSQDVARQAELQAKEERWRLDALLEVAPVGIAMSDANGKIVIANTENRNIWGNHPLSGGVCEYNLWKGWWADGSERQGQQLKSHDWALARALRGEEARGDIIEIEPFGKPGVRRTILLHAIPIRGAQQDIAGAVAVQMDITDQIKANAALGESEAKFRAITDTMPQMVWVADSEGLNEYDNRQWQAFTGVPLETLHGNGWQQVIHPDDLERLNEIWHRSLKTGHEYEVEHRIRHYSGIYRWVLNRALPVRDYTGKITRWMGTVTDIHENKLAHQALQEADRRKDEFLAMLAHELRNPLAPISAAADLLQIARLDEAQVRQASTIISRQIRHMTGLVDDLLDISRVTRNLIKMNKTRLDGKRIVFDAAEQVMPLIEARGHRLSVHTPPETAYVIGDQKRLVQVVSNLLNNAAKYTPEGGEISLAMEVYRSHVKISVTDNGIGMPAELVARAFDLFAQAERSSDRSQGGLGIGLALVKNLVELHGGTVAAYSKGTGKGSRFTVYLPHLQEQKDSSGHSPHAEVSITPDQPLKIMIVDDNADAAQMLGMFVEALGHTAIVEQHPVQALERSKKELPNVCLLDIGLPDMDGNELAQRLRAQPETAGVMLVAITGYGQEQDRQKALEAGFNHHFAKPVDTGKLAGLLRGIGKH